MQYEINRDMVYFHLCLMFVGKKVDFQIILKSSDTFGFQLIGQYFQDDKYHFIKEKIYREDGKEKYLQLYLLPNKDSNSEILLGNIIRNESEGLFIKHDFVPVDSFWEILFNEIILI